MTLTRNRIWPLLSLMTLLALVLGACTQTGGGPNASGGGDQADTNGELTTNMVAEPDTIAVHTVTDAVAVADALWWYIHTHDRHRCDHSTGYRFGTGQQL